MLLVAISLSKDISDHIRRVSFDYDNFIRLLKAHQVMADLSRQGRPYFQCQTPLHTILQKYRLPLFSPYDLR